MASPRIGSCRHNDPMTTGHNRPSEAAPADPLPTESDIVSDRDRIARYLHDQVIQRLFAVGLSLQGTLQRARTPDVHTRLSASIEDIQAIVQEIRDTIFELQSGPETDTELRKYLQTVVTDMTRNAGLRSTVQYAGPVTVIPPDMVEDVEAVLRETVSNVVRHAEATAVAVHLTVRDNVTVEVTDNGAGIPADLPRRSGLANLAARAQRSGGTFDIAPGPAGGSVARWTAPLP